MTVHFKAENMVGVANILSEILPKERIFFEEPMSKHTTFRIGGIADILIFPASMTEIQDIFSLGNKYRVPVTILGNGSNVLVLDRGIRGIVLQFGKAFGRIKKEGNNIIVLAGAILGQVSEYAAQCSLTGLEFAVGIPGSIGGAVYMNAGAYDGEMKGIIKEVHSLNQNGEEYCREQKELNLCYRHSLFQENDEVITKIILSLRQAEERQIRAKMNFFTLERKKKQPLEFPSAGSTFKRPEGYFAGTLIEKTGLKGFSVGDAEVSTKHAGFVINKGKATAKDVIMLIQAVEDRVFRAYGVKLIPEIRIIGEA